MSAPQQAPAELAAVPQPGPVPALKVGRVAQTQLENGVAVMVVPRPSVPRIEFRLSLPAGAAVGRDGAVSQLLAMGLPLGTASMDQSELSEQVQDLGGSFQVHQDQDRIYLHAAALAEAEEELYRLLAELVMAPAFPAADLATERAKLVEGLRMARATPHFPATEALQRLIYEEHPYGRPEPTEAAVNRTGRRALLDLHTLTFTPFAAQITVVGDIEPRRTQARLRRAFAAWRGPRRVPRLPAVRPHRRAELLFIPRPGSVQTVVMAGVSGPTQGDQEHMALVLATAILGGSFSSRMMSNLREDKGYTYSPHARLESRLLDGLAVASMEVRNEVTSAALVELYYEMGRLATVPVPAEEFHATKRYLAGARAIMLQTQAGLANALAQVRAHGLDHRYLERYSRELDSTSPDQVMAAAQRYLSPTAVTTVMVGNPDAAAGLEAVAPLRFSKSR